MYKTIYHVSVEDDNKVFFFSTDHCQEFDDEENFVPISSMDSREDVVKKMEGSGYREIQNPDPEYAA